MYQLVLGEWQLIFMPFLVVMVFIFLMIAMVYFYSKLRIPTVILTIWVFSLIIGITGLTVTYVPFTPWIQLLFMVFQTLFMYLTVSEAFIK